MRRRRGSAMVGIAVLTACVSTFATPVPLASGAAPGTPARPNVLWIVTDDQRVGTMGVLPHARAWFRDGGTTFRRAYVTTPLCCPSRASFFTGRYAHNHTVYTNAEESALALDQHLTIQNVLHDAGYTTAIAGKFLNSWDINTAPSWFDRFSTEQGYDYRDPVMNRDGVVAPVPGFATDIVRDEAAAMLNDFEAHDATPWFLYVAPIAPHSPYGTPYRYEDTPIGRWTGDPAVLETDRTDKPPIVQANSSTLAADRDVRVKQLRSLMAVDDLVRRLARMLQQLGESNTLAIFVSDNGYLWGEHGLNEAKRVPYQQSMRVPLYVRWPGRVAAGAIDPRLVGGIDLAPTILDAAGLPPDTLPVDGVSLFSDANRDHLLFEYYRDPDAPGFGNWSAILTPSFEYVEWYSNDLTKVTFTEYYDLVVDPWQLENLLADQVAGNEPNVERLGDWLADDRTCAGAACLTPLPVRRKGTAPV
jgi:arylsulfatase A-like enzyme